MSTTTRTISLLGAVLAGALILSAPALASPAALIPPAIPGVAAAPGPLASPFTAAATMGILAAKPDIGLAGQTFTLSGSGLAPNKDVSIVWNTANVTWVVDARPDSVDYLGRKADKINVVLATTRTNAQGAFSITLKAPADFGGIHDIYAVVDGQQVAKGGFLIARTATMTPKKGPIGTMITVTYSGLGSSLYEGGASLQYDNHYVGAIMANWTRGVAKVQIRAAGPVGRHTIEVTDAISFDYLNLPQSPIPWATGEHFTFTVTKDLGRPKNRLDWPVAMTPTLDAKTTMAAVSGSAAGKASATLSSASGPVMSKVGVSASGLTAGAPVSLVWSTVVGNRVNCTGTCWSFVSVPLGTGTAGADGTLTSNVQVPDGLGGWHVVQLLQGGAVKAQVPYYVKRSIVGNGVSKLRLKAGQPFTVHLKGLGWTQLDNTIAVDYDNSYIGYGCGFNSNGDVVMHLIATGAPGTHLIDMYPLLYTQQPSYANTPYGMIPVLTYARDVPGLALGYQLPAIRLAIQVVK
jgi:sulfopyruvate decarboxylase TPP-binding subunit